MSLLFDPRVAVAGARAPYPEAPPFSPPERYPEFPHRSEERWDPANRVYPALRRLLLALGLDRERFGRRDWNPLGAVIRPGDRVLLKPNWILHQHLSGRDPFSVVTHSSVIRAVLDYVWIALAGRGQVLVADAPQANTDWTRLMALTGMPELAARLRELHGVELDFRDLRQLTVVQRHGITLRREHTGAPAVLVDLGRESELAPLGETLAHLCGSDYDRHHTVACHTGLHSYAAARPVLEADVLVSLPKLKVHKKTGVSLNLKNMVGINANKNHIPHYRVGDRRSGGDEFPEVQGRIARTRDRLARTGIDLLLGRLDRLAAPLLAALLGRWQGRRGDAPELDAGDAGYNQRVIRSFYRQVLDKPVRAGNWAGNDTLWRAILDLNRIALYATAEGVIAAAPVRRFFSVIDGVVGGEGEGPMDPDPIDSGILIGGFNPVAVDLAAVDAMGLHPERIPLLVAAQRRGVRPLAPAGPPEVASEPGTGPGRPFRPPAGWPGLVRESLAAAAAP